MDTQLNILDKPLRPRLKLKQPRRKPRLRARHMQHRYKLTLKHRRRLCRVTKDT
jgi:hypothetical protein